MELVESEEAVEPKRRWGTLKSLSWSAYALAVIYFVYCRWALLGPEQEAREFTTLEPRLERIRRAEEMKKSALVTTQRNLAQLLPMYRFCKPEEVPIVNDRIAFNCWDLLSLEGLVYVPPSEHELVVVAKIKVDGNVMSSKTRRVTFSGGIVHKLKVGAYTDEGIAQNLQFGKVARPSVPAAVFVTLDDQEIFGAPLERTTILSVSREKMNYIGPPYVNETRELGLFSGEFNCIGAGADYSLELSLWIQLCGEPDFWVLDADLQRHIAQDSTPWFKKHWLETHDAGWYTPSAEPEQSLSTTAGPPTRPSSAEDKSSRKRGDGLEGSLGTH